MLPVSYDCLITFVRWSVSLLVVDLSEKPELFVSFYEFSRSFIQGHEFSTFSRQLFY